jgi:hypothetical protein
LRAIGPRKTSFVPAEKLTALLLFVDSKTAVRVSVPPVFHVPSPVSHSSAPWWTIVYSTVSPFAQTAEKARNPDTAPASVSAPVPVVVEVSRTRSATM